MTHLGHPNLIEAPAFAPAPQPPPAEDFRPTTAPRLAYLERQLGYFGGARYVAFRYEPRGEEVVWDDGRSSGFGTGGWQTFLDQVAPAAADCGANVGAGGADAPATHVLLIDRTTRQAFFAERAAAEALLAWQGRSGDGANAA